MKKFSVLFFILVLITMISNIVSSSADNNRTMPTSGILEIKTAVTDESVKWAYAQTIGTDPIDHMYKYVYAYFYVNGDLVSGNGVGYSVQPLFVDCKTVNHSLNESDRYYGHGLFGVGSSQYFVDSEWSDITSVYTYTESKLLKENIESSQIESERLELIGDQIVKFYNIDVTNFSYANIISASKKDLSNNEFLQSVHVNVLKPFMKHMNIGDKAPSYWIDYSSKIIYIGTIKKDKTYILYSSKWRESELNKFIWSDLKLYEKK